jgi:hypothetical protein
MVQLALALWSLLLFAGSDGAVAYAADASQLQRRLVSIETLIERSSGAKQIEISGIAAALSKRDVARALHKQASSALQSGDDKTAARLLDDAARAMLEAVRLAAPEQITDQKDKRDFDARLASAGALLDAQKRIAAEKGGDPQALALVQKIEALLLRARELAVAGNLAEARSSLDQGYLASKAAVANMRAGDTLVRSLKFETKQEEYLYELDRNDTHRMLIEVLLQEKRANASVDGMVRKSIEAAQHLRRLAEEQAAAQDHVAAIKTLEDSTKELVKAIRGAGVYIPG